MTWSGLVWQAISFSKPTLVLKKALLKIKKLLIMIRYKMLFKKCLQQICCMLERVKLEGETSELFRVIRVNNQVNDTGAILPGVIYWKWFIKEES